MKKKILSLFAVLLLILTVCCSCQRVTASMLMLNASAKMSNLDAVEMQGTITLKMAVTGLSIEVPIHFNVKRTMLKSEQPVQQIELDMSFMQQKIEAVLYEEGEYQYSAVTAGGQTVKSKQKADEDEETDASLWDFEEKDLVDIDVTYNEDRTQTVAFTLAGEKIAKLFDISAFGLTAENAVAEDTTLYCTVGKDGYFQDIRLTPTFTGVQNDINTTYSLDIEIAFVDPGKDVVITPPAGYQDFPEQESSGGLFA